MMPAKRLTLAASIYRFHPHNTTFSLVRTWQLPHSRPGFALSALIEIMRNDSTSCEHRPGFFRDIGACWELVIAPPTSPAGSTTLGILHPSEQNADRVLDRLQGHLVRAALNGTTPFGGAR